MATTNGTEAAHLQESASATEVWSGLKSPLLRVTNGRLSSFLGKEVFGTFSTGRRNGIFAILVADGYLRNALWKVSGEAPSRKRTLPAGLGLKADFGA